MKISTLVSQLSAALVLLSTTAVASNGTHSTGASGAASAMGGTAVGNYTTEMEALYRNPALLSSQATELMSPRVELSLAFAKHSSEGTMNPTGDTLGAYSVSKDPVNVLPNLAAGMKISESVAVGLGIIALGGSSVDYTGDANLSEQKSEQILYRFTPAVSYAPIKNVQVGAGLVIGYGAVALNSGTPQTTRPKSSAWAVGGLFGASATPVENLRVGLSVLTKTAFNYKSVYDLGSLDTGAASGTLNDVIFAEPSEYAVGASYVTGDFLFAADFRYIAWGQAQGYSDLGWNDQSVIQLGAQYKLTPSLALRLGAIYGKSPIADNDAVNGDEQYQFQGVTVKRGFVSMANIVGFTATTELEIDFGAGYQISEEASVDLALVFCPTKTVTQKSAAGTFTSAGGTDFATSSKASEWAIVAGINYQL